MSAGVVTGILKGRKGGEKEAKKVSTQWEGVSANCSDNGSMFRAVFHTMERCFAAVSHGVEEWRGAVGGGAGNSEK